MVKLTLLYGHPQDAAAFERYYAETHLPIAAKIQGLRRAEFSRATGAPDGGKPAYHRIAELYFDDDQHMQKVMGSPEAVAAVADLPNFATGGVTVLASEIT
jgi:uncharacterized protein (TIGR02118 family)